MKRKSILAALLLVACLLPAQELSVPDRPRYIFQRLGENVSLTTMTVTSLAQDSKGFMWIGTQSGLFRYDGHRARKYGLNDGISSTVIDQVVMGPRNRVIVGTHKGVSISEQDTFLEMPMPPGASLEPRYQFVAADMLGNVYLATTKGIYRYTIDEPNAYSAVKIEGTEPESTPVEAIFAAPDGRVWFAAGNRLGVLRANQEAKWLPVTTKLPPEPVIAILEDGNGTLWIRTAKRLSHYDPGSQEIVPEKEKIPDANDFGIPVVDRSGNLLVPTVAGIYRRVGGKWEAIDRTRGMPVNAAYSVTEDHEGAYWVGLAGGGILRWQGTKSWKGWTEAEGLPDNVIWAVSRDEQKRLWVGTNNGVAMWDSKQHRWRTWNAETGLNGSVVRSIATTNDGAIWVLSFPGGLTRFDSSTLTPVRVKTPSPEPSAMVRGPDGRLWLASKDYLKALNSRTGTFEFEDVSVPDNVKGKYSHISITHGVMWSGGRNGLARFDGKSWQVFTAKNGLKEDFITELAAVGANEVWFHYNEAYGLWRLKIVDGKAEVRKFTTADDLPADEVYMVGADHGGNVWAGGPLGLTMFPREGSVQHFTRSDGLIWDDLDAEAFYADEDGSLFFGTSGGLARYEPKKTKEENVAVPNVVITSAQLGSKEHNRESTVRVPYKESTLQVQFAALTYRDMDRVRCFYKLDGLETEANETTLREARYPALAAGDYTFLVYCKSATGAVSPPASFKFTIAPPWWRRWDMRAIAIALLLLGVAGIIRFRTAHLERERLRLEVAVAQRNTELARTNQELKEASLTDPLTGARNRRFFDLIMPSDVNQAVRTYSPPLSLSGGRNRDLVLYLIDIDHFKLINDDHGHAAGDCVLVEISNRIHSVMRQTDVLIRWGGEEFLLVSRAAERSEAAQLALRVLNAVGADSYEIPGVDKPIMKTCSVGYAPFPWFTENPELVDYETVLKMADRALYRAKESGRNRAFGVVPIGNGANVPSMAFDDLEFDWSELRGPQEADSARTES